MARATNKKKNEFAERIKARNFPLSLKIALSFMVIFGLAFALYRLVFSGNPTKIGQTETIKVTKGLVNPKLSLTGQIVSSREIAVNFENSGELKVIYVKVGDKVKKGQKLAKIDDTELKRKVKLAKINLESAQARLVQLKSSPSAAQKKVQELQVQNALAEWNKAKEDLEELKKDPKATDEQIEQAEEKVDQAEYQYKLAVAQAEANSGSPTKAEIKAQEAAVEQAKASYEEALDNLKSAVLYAPVSGTVIAVNGEVGEQVSAGPSTGSTQVSSSGTQSSETQSGGSSNVSNNSAPSSFIVIADLENLRVKATVDQADIPKVKVGQKVSIEFDAFPDKSFEGSVVTIDPQPVVSQDVVTYYIYISLKEADSAIKLGMTANLEIDLGKKENVLVVPNMAIRTVEGKKYVNKLIDGNPVQVPIETGVSDDKYTEIVSGLSEGDEVQVTLYSGFTGQQGAGGMTQGSRQTGSSGSRTPGFGPGVFMGR